MTPNVKNEAEHVYHRVDIKSLPSFSKLNVQVQQIVQNSTWWDLYGVDWMHVATGVGVLVPGGLLLLASEGLPQQALGLFLLGCYQGILANKSGHVAMHSGMAESPLWNAIWRRVFVDFVGGFSTKLAENIHVKMHHPHTNIIGLGDSSTWKVPFLSRVPYMFLAPLLFPILTPIVSVSHLVADRDWPELALHGSLSTAGVACHMYLLMAVSGFSLSGAALCLCMFRAVLAIPYIHVNIFQHIGLPMFSAENRPARIYQMSNGVLNISRNPLLDFTFGHGLISCHVEHHLFPRLSDNMCLKVQPVVRSYLTENGLPYNEKSYWNRLVFFLKDYKRLMVNAPPITHFVGIQ